MSPVPADLEGFKPTLRVRGARGAVPARVEADVVVVGSGASGLTAAYSAASRGLEVVVLEAAAQPGGTTMKSAGGFMVTENRFMATAGYVEDRDMTLRLMAKTSFPHLYDPSEPRLGLEQLDWDLITTFYDRSNEIVTRLEDEGALRVSITPSAAGDPRGLPSYFAQLHEEEQIPYCRTLGPLSADGLPGYGRELIAQLLAGAEREGVAVLCNQRVSEILTDGGEVIGVESTDVDGATHTFAARRGVIFATGGFAHNRELLEKHMPGIVLGSCAVPTAQGDFLTLSSDLDVATAHLDCAWWGEVPAEPCIANPELLALLFYPYGDSLIYVDRHGRRVVNEKAVYDQRGPIHFALDEDGDQPNRLLFWIYDDAVAKEPTNLAPMRFPLPAVGEHADYVISAPTLETLGVEVASRLESLAPHSRDLTLAKNWAVNVQESIATFNGYATTGIDEEFGRGSQPIQQDATGYHRVGNHPNPTMYPMSTTGPYHCIITAAGVLDTKGGPRINPQAQVLRSDLTPVPRLFGAGNCVASAAASAYWTGGVTLGLGMVYGYIAGEEIGRLSPRSAAAEKAGTAA